MKKLVLLALPAIATAAMAAGPAPVSEIVITGTSNQTAALTSASVRNTAQGVNSKAQQNLASNAGDVLISGTSNQTVNAFGGSVSNTSNANTLAQQNMSSNVGEVTIRGRSTQLTVLRGASVNNVATGFNAAAVQNIASNNSCLVCSVLGTR